MISVVVPAYNEEKQIARCLDSLARQQTHQQFEVVLVNNASTDATEQIAKQFLEKFSLAILFEETKGRGAARAAGFQAARGDIILSTDADTEVPPDWIEKMAEGLRRSGTVAVAGTMVVKDCGKIAGTIFNFVQPLAARAYRLLFGHYWLGGYNFAIYRDVYQRSGGFDPSLNAMEDTDLGFRVKKIGKIRFLSEAVVRFSGRRFDSHLLRGLGVYIIQFLNYYLGRAKHVHLSDIR